MRTPPSPRKDETMRTLTLHTSAEALPPVPPPPPVAVRTLSSLFATYAAEFGPEVTPHTHYSFQLLFAQIITTGQKVDQNHRFENGPRRHVGALVPCCRWKNDQKRGLGAMMGMD